MPPKLQNDGDLDIEFEGELIATVDSDSDHRWTELKLWQTKGGAYVCQTIGHSSVEGEKMRSRCTIEEVMKVFGNGRLAVDLYKKINITTRYIE